MKKIAKIQTNIDLLNKGHDMIIEEPLLLELHRITNEHLQEYNLSHKEFVYVLNSFYAGQTYHAIEGTKKVFLSDYRKLILDNEKVKYAWIKLIRKKMIAPGPFAKAIDDYYRVSN